MAYVYVQRTGELFEAAGHVVGNGYSGHGEGLNNPEWEDKVGAGPVPCGKYAIGSPHTPIDHLGPVALPLIPAPENDMKGRCGFFIHGDNQFLNQSASNGCIILVRPVRELLAYHAREKLLIVVAERDDVAGLYKSMTP
jgi:hypothetical protein